ncbi:MAG TPA: hypothetical protein VHD85_22910, partial [Terracidiphilus sp.]|nr:hypothetical protein [Terracidiphilus sp.]
MTVDDLPEGVKAVTYLLHPSSKSARVQSVPYGVQGFREDISAYGDFFITVTAEGFRPRSNEWFAIAFATKLSDALSVGHPPIARTKEVDEAIMELASHDPDSLLASQPSNQSDNTSKLQLRIFDGSRRLFSAPAQFLVTITDGNQTQQFRDFVSTNVTQFHLPFFDNFADNYTVVVWADGYKQVGFTPVTLTNQFPEALDLMLIPADPGFNFTDACWEAVRATYPFIGSDLDATTGARRYEALLDNSERTLACFLNLCEAMRQITLSQGTPLDYIKRLIWDTLTPKQDGFFAWCKPALIDQLKVGAEARQFAPVINPGVFRRGATSSWKEVVFGDVQVRFTFYENNRNAVDDVDCV